MRFDDIFRPKVCSATVISYHSDALDYIEPLLTSSQGCGSCSHNTVKWCHDQGRPAGSPQFDSFGGDDEIKKKALDNRLYSKPSQPSL